MSDTMLLDGIFKQSQDTGKAYLLRLDVDRLVAPCYESASLTPKKPKYGGWESMQIAGHSIGHWLSATAAMVDVTGDEDLLEKLVYAVDELSFVQSRDPYGYVSGFARDCFDKVFTGNFEASNFNLGGSWVPWYSLHKIFAGLIDAYRLAGIGKALEAVTRLADWAVHGMKNLTEEQFQLMLTCEHGGMNEAMADLYLLTNNPAYLELAIRFCHKAVLDPLAKGLDELEGKHANTQIPKVIGAAKLYLITGEEHYRRTAEFFWTIVTQTRSYVMGGNSIFEHFGAPHGEETGVETAETCNTYNMLKLTALLYRWSPKAEYMDFYEKALYNHILASQDPDTGKKMYFLSTEPGHFKVYGTEENSFWCCTGTGMENPARYTREIYHEAEDAIYVNLFIASRASFAGHHAAIVQETEFPQANRTRLIMEKAPSEAFKLRIRIPSWVAGSATAVVNGTDAYSAAEPGYLEIDRHWSAGDAIDITLPMVLRLHKTRDGTGKAAFLYGPVVLAGALGREHFPESDIVDNHLKLHHHPLINVPALVTEETDIRKWVTPVEDAPLTFITGPVGQPGDTRVTLIPFYQLHHQRYTVYWDIMGPEQFRGFHDREKRERELLKAVTVDAVSPYEQQSEVEHSLTFHQSRTGYSAHAKSGYRDAYDGGAFSYRMAVLPDRPMLLQVTYYTRDGAAAVVNGVRMEREFEIRLDGRVIATPALSADQEERLYTVTYELPAELTNGKQQAEVQFAAPPGKIAGGVYKLRIIDRERYDQLQMQEAAGEK